MLAGPSPRPPPAHPDRWRATATEDDGPRTVLGTPQTPSSPLGGNGRRVGLSWRTRRLGEYRGATARAVGIRWRRLRLLADALVFDALVTAPVAILGVRGCQPQWGSSGGSSGAGGGGGGGPRCRSPWCTSCIQPSRYFRRFFRLTCTCVSDGPRLRATPRSEPQSHKGSRESYNIWEKRASSAKLSAHLWSSGLCELCELGCMRNGGATACIP